MKIDPPNDGEPRWTPNTDVVVHETGEVNNLSIENRSDVEVFIQLDSCKAEGLANNTQVRVGRSESERNKTRRASAPQ